MPVVTNQYVIDEKSVDVSGIEIVTIEELFNPSGGYLMDPEEVELPSFESARTSGKPHGLISAYSANTN